MFGARLSSTANTNRRRRRRDRNGFLLLDALLALLLAAMIVICGMTAMMVSSSASDAAKQTTIAYNAARQAIENVRGFYGAPLPAQTNGSLIGSVPQIADLGTGASGTLTIAAYRNTVKQVTVNISWRAGGRGQQRTISITTLVAPGGVTP